MHVQHTLTRAKKATNMFKGDTMFCYICERGNFGTTANSDIY